MQKTTFSNTVSTGFAMFSMFFGAGNVVFPLAMGQYVQDNNVYAIIGLLITAVGVPFLGLASMTLFDGDYNKFFERIGKLPGFLIVLFIMGLIGPFGAMPRCVALSFSTIKMFIPGISLPLFSAIACFVIFLLSYKRRTLIDILGTILTPLLLLSLGLIIIKGLWGAESMQESELTQISSFFYGLKEGYQTMDLLGAFFFSSVVILCLKRGMHPEHQNDYKKLIQMILRASIIGASLLGLIYVGFSFVAAYHGESLIGVSDDEMLGYLAISFLGPYAGLISSIAVSLACLTTAIALAAVFSEYLHEDITMEKISYRSALIITLALTFFVSTLQFAGIKKMLIPVLTLCYPALITLCVVNLLYKLYNFKPVKVPVLIVFVLSILEYMLEQ